ncbi:MAG: SDR family NAD(P)-dependent oxidoreductase [Planctomycetota bacterium]
MSVVTGASRGIGKEIARGLLQAGHTVVCISRDPERGEQARAELAAAGNLEWIAADLALKGEVRRIAPALRERGVDLLVNNAGVFMNDRRTTAEGLELTFAVNQMAPFLLVQELAPARTVNVGSEAHRRAPFELTDLQGERDYSGMRAYANSKFAMVLFSRELARRDRLAVCLHPGVVDTGLLDSYLQDVPWLLRIGAALVRPLFTSEAKAARGVLDIALDPELARHNGAYFTGGRTREPDEGARSDATALVWWEAVSALSP